MYIDNTFLEEAVHTVFRFSNISIILNGLKPGAGALRTKTFITRTRKTRTFKTETFKT